MARFTAYGQSVPSRQARCHACSVTRVTLVAIVGMRRPAGVMVSIAGWMLDAVACAGMTMGAPRVDLAALRKTLIRLVAHNRDQSRNFCCADGGNDAELRQVATQRVDHLSTLIDQKGPGLEHDGGGLLISGFYWHEAHDLTGHRLADRFGIRRVGLAALYERCADLKMQLARPDQRLHCGGLFHSGALQPLAPNRD